MSSFSKLVLQNFKKLHRTRLKVFAGDEMALTAARQRINNEFKKNKDVMDEKTIKSMIKFGNEVEIELRTHVIQAKQTKPGIFDYNSFGRQISPGKNEQETQEVKINEETLKLENVPFNDKAIPEEGIVTDRPCCQDQARNK